MKQEVYSCLKMMESLRNSSVVFLNSKNYHPTSELRVQYNLITGRLSEHLSKEQMKFVPEVEGGIDSEVLPALCSATAVVIAYLRSLDSTLEKELEAKEKQLSRKEEEVDRLWKFLMKSAEIMKEIPEARRSEWVAEMKKAHREIEGYTKPKPGEEKG